MTTVALLADPPEEGLVLPELLDAVLTEAQAVSLHRALIGDVSEAICNSGGELLVNYRPADHLPEGTADPERAIRSVIEDSLDDAGIGADGVRYEVQVGSTFAARAGNTVTHLLEREGVRTAAVVTPAAAFLGREHVDSAAMKLRRSDVVLGPTSDGGVYYAGFARPIDFTDAYAHPAVETFVARASEAERSVDFVPMLPTIRTPADLQTAIPFLRARADAGTRVPSRTSAVLDELSIGVE